MAEHDPGTLELPGTTVFRDPGPVDVGSSVPAQYTLASWQYSALAVLVLVGAWWLVTGMGLVLPLYLPGPAAVLRKLVEVSRDGYMDATLWQHVRRGWGGGSSRGCWLS